MCPVNLMHMCAGPLETFNSFCRRYHTTLDYIFVPNCLLSSITSAKTFEADPDNTSDHLPIKLTLTINILHLVLEILSVPRKSPKLNGLNFHLK